LRLFADPSNREALQAAVVGQPSVAGYLRAHLWRLTAGDYFALLAYLPRSPAHEAALEALRERVRAERRVATSLGFGPGFLHSTGQLHHDGPNSGVFLQLTRDVVEDLPVPGKKYGFGVCEAAQAQGDRALLSERQRRALRIHLGPDLRSGLQSLQRAFDGALADHPPAGPEPQLSK